MENATLKNLTFQNLIAYASDTRCKLEYIETEIFARMQARANKHKTPRVRAANGTNHSEGQL